MIYPLYSVYDRRQNGLPVMVFGSPQECADAMGISVDTFYSICTREKTQKNTSQRWEIHREEEENKK